MQIEGEKDNIGQIEHAMAAAVSEIEAMDPQSLEEVMRRPDWLKWKAAIQEELGAVTKAGTWGIIEGLKKGTLSKINGYLKSRKTQQEELSVTKLN